MNEITRRSYVADCEIGLKRWNRLIKKAGYDITLTLPSTRFRRNIGIWAGIKSNLEGKIISEEEFISHADSWLPSDNDKKFIKSLMVQVTDLDQTAGWIAPPSRGINNLDVEYEYVELKQ
jgi:benzoyl-CoA 2,3-dioxygenase component B